VREGILVVKKTDDKRIFWLFNDKLISAKLIFGGGIINKYVDAEEHVLSLLKLDPMENGFILLFFILFYFFKNYF
jgi:hypothetical protein